MQHSGRIKEDVFSNENAMGQNIYKTTRYIYKPNKLAKASLHPFYRIR